MSKRARIDKRKTRVVQSTAVRKSRETTRSIVSTKTRYVHTPTTIGVSGNLPKMKPTIRRKIRVTPVVVQRNGDLGRRIALRIIPETNRERSFPNRWLFDWAAWETGPCWGKSVGRARKTRRFSPNGTQLRRCTATVACSSGAARAWLSGGPSAGRCRPPSAVRSSRRVEPNELCPLDGRGNDAN